MKKPLKLLIVEDNPADARLVLAELRAADFEPTWKRIETEPEFLAEIQNLPDIILSDYSMPEFSGLRALELLAASGLDIPLILISGTVGEEEAVEAMHQGATDYLLKDRILRIGSTVERALQEAQAKQDRRLAAFALKDAEAEFRTLTEAMPQIVWVMRPDGSNIYFNRHWADYTGLTPEESVGHGWIKSFHPEDQPRAWEAWQKAMAKIGTYSIEVRLRRADETYRWWLIRGVPQQDIQGNILKWIGTCTDIHDLKAAEAELRLLNSAVEQSKESILITDAELALPGPRMIFVNPAFTQMTGYTAAEAIGKTPRILQGPHTDKAVMQQLREKLQRGEVFDGEAIQYRKDGTEYHQEWQVAPIRNASGTITHYVAIQRDVTARKLAETALRESNLRYHLLFENMLEGYAYCRAVFEHGRLTDFIYLEVNSAFGKHTGLNDVTGKKVSDVIPEFRKFNRELFELYERVTLTGQPERCETYVTPLDIWLSIAVYSFDLEHFVAVFDNITERKKSQELLNKSSQRLALATESAQLGIWDWDIATNKLEWDARMFELYGIGRGNFSGSYQTWQRGIHPDDQALGDAAITAAIAGTKEFNLEFRVLWPNGEVHHIEGHAIVLRAEDGAARRMIGVNQDITERKYLETSHARLAMSVDQSSETVVITDTHGTILYANPAFEKTSGYTVAEALGKNPRLLKSGKHAAEFYIEMWEKLTRDGCWQGNIINRRKDGTFYEEETIISIIRDEAGQVINYVAVKRDVTGEVQLAAQYRQSQKMEGIGLLAGGVAHDFNNILAVIMMQAQFAGLHNDLPPQVQESLAGITAATERAANLTRQLLLFSRKEVMQPRNLDLNEIVKNMSKMLQRTIREDVQLQLHLHSAPLLTYSDAGMLEQVLMNLAVNARDAMPNGGRLLIETSEKVIAPGQADFDLDVMPGCYVCLCVSDTGCGISPESQSRIFEPFFTTKEPGKGTGLGLSTVFGIVKQHNGWVRLYSEIGKGTTFQVFLPGSSVPADAALDQAKTKPKPRGGSETILVTEDNEPVRTLVRRLLEQYGYHILEAADGIAAQRVWAEHRGQIALLLTDLVMPGGVNGIELAGLLQSQQPGLKIIFTSGYSAEIAGQELKLKAGQSFIQKPCPPDQILQAVRKSLDG